MFNLELEKQCILTAQDRYDIISAAIQDSYDDGFMNSFIFQRVLYCFAFAALDNSDLETRQEVFMKILKD